MSAPSEVSFVTIFSYPLSIEYMFVISVVPSAARPAMITTKTVTVPELALHRSFGEGPFSNKTDDWSDARWYVNNIRNVFWLIKKDSDDALPNHADLLSAE